MNQSPRHTGFAQVPRIVTRGAKYKHLSLIEKGLYTCLKDICGDEGECFYTLRNLAEEINTSISTLSRYIPKLHDYGLIHAEKKPQTHNNHEVWHIRIVNIWQENDSLYASKNTQDCFTEKQSSVSPGNNVTKFVANRNDSVSQRNKNQGTDAQDCFYLNARIISLCEEDLLNERVVIPSHFSSLQEYVQRTKAILILCGQKLRATIPVTDESCQYASSLARANASNDAIEAVIGRMKADAFWKDKLSLRLVAKHFSDEWTVIQQQQQQQQSPSASSTPDFAPNSTPDDIERWKARHAAKKAAIG